MQLFTFIIVLSFSTAFGANFKLNFNSSELEFDKSVTNMDLVMAKKNGKTNINFHVELLQDLDNLIVIVAVFEKEKGHYHSIANNSMSLCRVLEKTVSNPVVKLVLAELMKFSNLPTACPMLKNKYYLKDFVLNEDLLPPFVLPPEGSYKTYLQFDRVVNGEQKMIAKVIIHTKIEHKGMF